MDVRKNVLTAIETNADLCSKIVSRRNLSPMKKCLKLDNEPRRKRRKKKNMNKNEKMRNIIIDIEKEIEEQLDVKMEDNDFTTTNVKGILKELIMDEDMKEMVRQTLHPGAKAKCYEPKLTRAKVRKLLELRPDLKIPILWPIPQNNTNFVSECLSLINEDYDENSSEDEEYKPEEDESDLNDSFFQSESDILDLEPSPNGSFCIEMNSPSADPSGKSAAVEENIGQRTRSKLPLTEKRLEDLEQTFNPPDITGDMYDCDIDNEDYLNFLREYNTSYDRGGLELADFDDDPDDDPEYRIPADAERVDREELRQDESTEVPSAELWQLINEIINNNNESMKTHMDRKKILEVNSTDGESGGDYPSINIPVEPPLEVPVPEPLSPTEIILPKTPKQQNSEPLKRESTESPQRPNSQLPESLGIILSERQNVESLLKNSNQNVPVLSKQQRLLFEQQLRQHVQLTTMHFLQCYKHPIFFQFASEMKNLLVTLQLLTKKNKKSAYYASNLDDALKLVHDWEQAMVHIPDPETDFLLRSKQMRKIRFFPSELMKMLCKSSVFLYPLLLPEKLFSKKFSGRMEKKKPKEMAKSEEWLLAVGLQQFCEYVQSSQQLDHSQSPTREALKLTIYYLLPHYAPSYLLSVLRKKSSDDSSNSSIKYYLEHKKAPPLKHFVVPVSPIPLYKQPYDLLPKIWQDYISRNFVVLERR